jgi:CTP:molybdopterin cytidylyltransferase MocA
VRIAGLVLAAGAGTRLGRPKALVVVDGRRFVDLAVYHLRAGGADPIFVVVGATEVGHTDAIVVANDRWADGIGSSLTAGLVAARSYDQAIAPLDGVVVTLVDQPRIGPEAVGRVLDAGRAGAHAAVATYGGVPLHPVYLHIDSWSGVAELAQGERGARPYLDANADRVEPVACDGLGDGADVDTQIDLDRLG